MPSTKGCGKYAICRIAAFGQFFVILHKPKNLIIMKRSLLFSLGLSCLVVISACKKDDEDDDDNTPTVTTPANPMPTPDDADGVCVSIKSASVVDAPIVGPQTTFIGLAVAAFPNSSGTFLEAGTVTCNSSGLTKNDNNSYTFTPNANNPSGIDFSNSNDWDVSGAGSITGFSYSNSTDIPEIGDITADGTVNTGSSLNLGIDMGNSNTDLHGADSIYYGVYGPDGQLIHATGGGTTSHTFTASQMATVGAGTGFVQVAAVTFNQQNLSGQTIYFVNEGVLTKSVTFE